MKIIWSDEASNDLETIYEFYFAKSPNAAIRIYNAIVDEVEVLRTHPNIAAIEPVLQGKEYIFRSLVVYAGLFKVIYFVDKETIYIHGIWCCRADPKNLLR